MNKPFTLNTYCDGLGGKAKLTLVRGLPGSGKSTLVRGWISWAPKAVHLEADMFFEQGGRYEFDASQLHRAHLWCLTSARILLSQGYEVYVSNTFTTFKEMQEYVSFALTQGYGLSFCTMHTNYGSIHGVPEETMQRMRDRFESHQQIWEKIDAF